MHIKREAYARSEAARTVKLEKLKVQLAPDSSEVLLQQAPGGDFNTPSRYSYTISLSLDDCERVIQALGSASPEQRDSVRKALAPALPALIRLGLICVGER